jgi:hypothetical protein
MADRELSAFSQSTEASETVSASAAPQIAWPQFGWRDIPTFAGIVGTLAVTLSVAREAGFFSVLDLKLMSLLSTNDMLVNSFVAIPAIASGLGFVVGLVGSLFAWLPRRVHRFLYSRLKPQLHSSVYAFSFKYRVPLMVAALLLSVWVAGMLGAREAADALETEAHNYELTLTTGETIQVNLVVATSDTLIVTRNPSEISVVPRAQVKLLKLRAPTTN